MRGAVYKNGDKQLLTQDWLESESESRCERRSVGQSVLVSSPVPLPTIRLVLSTYLLPGNAFTEPLLSNLEATTRAPRCWVLHILPREPNFPKIISIISKLFKLKKFWGEIIAYFPFIRHGPHIKRRLQQFFYCCVCIRWRGNVSTEPLSSNDKGIHIVV
jgi:hypothetical protein